MITHCPICRYSLEGLPERHRCPECGIEYDRRAVQFDPRERGRIKSDVWFMVTSLLLVTALATWSGRWAGFAFYLVFGTFLLLRSIHFAQQAEKMTTIVSPDRVQVFVDRRLHRNIDFAQVRYAERAITTGAIRFYCGSEVLGTIRANQYYTRKITKQIALALQTQLGDRFRFVITHTPCIELPE